MNHFFLKMHIFKLAVFIFFSIDFSIHAFSQHYMDNWSFGVNAGLNFSTGVPVFQNSPMKSLEATATISDSLGNLLFFTNGISIWDSDGNIMPHGDSLEIAQQLDEPYYGSSVTQGAIIIPAVGYPDEYYVFYLASASTLGGPGPFQLMYSVVDMTLHDGKGDIKLPQKNVPVPGGGDKMWEKMTAVKHGNGKDWWLVVISLTESLDSSYFEKFLITEDGISTPQFQAYSIFYFGGGLETAFSELGQMKFSLSGKKIGVTRGSFIDVFDFDRCDGMFSNHLTIDSVNYENYGLEFSPDETKLYASSTVQSPVKAELIQICLDCNVPIKTLLYTHPTTYNFSQLQIGPDGKIYLGFAEVGFLDDNAHYLSVINYPDSFGLACDFELATFALGDSAHMSYGLPNFVNYDLSALTGPDSCETIIEAIPEIHANDDIIIFPNPATNFIYFADKQRNILDNIESVKFYDVTGRLCKSFSNTVSVIDISEMQPGIYILRIKDSKEKLYLRKLEIIK